MKLNNFFRFSFLIVTFIAVISCQSTESSEYENPVHYDKTEQIESEIDRLIQNDKPAEALQWIFHYKKRKDLEQLDLDSLDLTGREDDALAGMEEKLNTALKKKDYPAAISIYESLMTIGRDDLLGEFPDSARLKADHISYLAEIDRVGAAAGLISNNYMDLSIFTEEDLHFLETRFSSGENRKALALILHEQKRRNLEIRSEAESILSHTVTMEDLIEGTVTVWVDKGLRLEKGVGYPDQVIGSGFFVDKSGYILTNYHVIESEVNPEYQGYSKLFIKLSDDRGEKIPAKVVGWDRHFDIALLKTEIEAPYVFSFSSEDQYSLGQKIFAIGSPGGLNNTITSGTVSAVNRQLMSMGESVQIDVPINPGNSGGPLLSPEGNVKGIIFAGIEDFEGINFAINGNYVKNFLPALYEGGALTHPWLGIGGFQEYDTLETLYVVPDSPASRIDIARGDVIQRINGIEVVRNQDVRDIIMRMVPGTIINLEWKHEGEAVSSILTLAERPDIPFSYAIKHDKRESLIPAIFGMVLEKVRKEQYQVKKVYTGSNADGANISANDVISLKKWVVNEKDGYVLMQFLFKGTKAGYLESAIQLGSMLESSIFF
ncbi:MAG: hypothetical protein B6241_04245 [Spirochaetaceae bacterium 4572_59]|nr:MAG: hypothetical protein B6241_04245 [Spirochaetaceae bacterium 4572_59]